MTLRLTKPSLSLSRSQSTAKPETSARVGPAVTGKPDPTKQASQIKDRSPVRNAAEQISNTADRFETTASRPSFEGPIRERTPGGSGTSVGGQPIPEHQQPWNQETYGEKIDRNRADRGLPPIFVEPDEEISSPNGQGTGETYGERIDRNRAERGLPPLYSDQEPGVFSPHGPGSGETYAERIERNREYAEQVFGDKP